MATIRDPSHLAIVLAGAFLTEFKVKLKNEILKAVSADVDKFCDDAAASLKPRVEMFQDNFLQKQLFEIIVKHEKA